MGSVHQRESPSSPLVRVNAPVTDSPCDPNRRRSEKAAVTGRRRGEGSDPAALTGSFDGAAVEVGDGRDGVVAIEWDEEVGPGDPFLLPGHLGLVMSAQPSGSAANHHWCLHLPGQRAVFPGVQIITVEDCSTASVRTCLTRYYRTSKRSGDTTPVEINSLWTCNDGR